MLPPYSASPPDDDALGAKFVFCRPGGFLSRWRWRTNAQTFYLDPAQSDVQLAHFPLRPERRHYFFFNRPDGKAIRKDAPDQ